MYRGSAGRRQTDTEESLIIFQILSTPCRDTARFNTRRSGWGGAWVAGRAWRRWAYTFRWEGGWVHNSTLTLNYLLCVPFRHAFSLLPLTSFYPVLIDMAPLLRSN